MDKKATENVIPPNRKGAKTDTSYTEAYPTPAEAAIALEQSKQRLLNISNWHTYAGAGTADFQLTDPAGNLVNRLAQKGDHFRINIPGPGSKTGDGYDWVQIQSILEDEEKERDMTYIAITVRPATNPNNSNQDVAHFFKDDASSTFMVYREGLTVGAEVHGRNEQPNTNTENIIDKARNIAVAAGALLGLSDIQWKSLVKGLIKSESI